MIWVAWRQGRTEVLIATVLLVLLAAVLVPTGMHMMSVYDHLGLPACSGHSTDACSEASGEFSQRFAQLGGLLGWLNLVPGVIGMVLAAPFILDLESGTHRLVWTQSVTPRRIVAVRLGCSIALCLAAGLAISVLFTWWHGPLGHLQGRLQPSAFDFEGTAPMAYVLFALGLTLAVGVLSRRTVPSIIVGFVGYLAGRIVVDTWLRQRYASPQSITWPLSSRGPDLSHTWVLEQQPSDRLGHTIHLSPVLLGACAQHAETCARPVRAAFTHVIYQPAGRFWAFQVTETTLFGGIALTLIAFSAWWVLERSS